MMILIASMLFKVTATLAAALGAAWAASRSRAAVRHLILAAAFVVLLVLPFASMIAPSVAVPLPIAAPRAAAILTAQNAGEPIGPPDAGRDPGGSVARAQDRSPWPSWTQFTIGVWALGTALFLAPLVAGLMQVRRLRRSALPWRKGRTTLELLAPDAGIPSSVDVLLHESVPGPMTCGISRPAIVLPIDAQRWSGEDVRRAIVHELEHVVRRDWLSQCIARIVCACYWFHPLVWIAWRELSLAAERACDDAVLRRAEPTAYADQLVLLAERLSAAAHPPLLAMANRHDLAARVRAVLDHRQRRGRAGTAWIAIAGAVVALLVTTMSPIRIVASADLARQSSPASGSSAPDTERFDVVSIKPCESEPPTPPGQRSSQGGFPSVSPGRFSIECGTVERLISNAYVLNGEPLTNQQARIGDIDWLKNVPGWLRSEKFTIEAKAEGTPDRKVMLGPMLRNLLADRFKLKLHREHDERPVYVMTVAKGGLKISPDTCDERGPDGPAPGREYIAQLAAGAKPICGVMNMQGTPGRRKWTIGGTTMAHFAGTLSTTMDYFVIDKTGIEGTFNIHLEFAPDEHVPGADKRYGPPTSFPEPDGPTIFKALEQQLGLKLDATKGPHGFLVIDHIERPTPNSGPAILSESEQGRRGAAPPSRPIQGDASTRAMEAALKNELVMIRAAIDRYETSTRRYPASLADLVGGGYLATIPDDPFTRGADWRTVAAKSDPPNPSAPPSIRDVKSASTLIALDGTRYSDW